MIPIYDLMRAHTHDGNTTNEVPIRGYDVGLSYGFYNATQWTINNLPDDHGHQIADIHDTEHIQQIRADQWSHYNQIMLDIETLDEMLFERFPNWTAEQRIRREDEIRLELYRRFKRYLPDPSTQIIQYNKRSHLTIDGDVYSDALVVSRYRSPREPQTADEFLETIDVAFEQIDQAAGVPLYLNIGPRRYGQPGDPFYNQLMDLDEWSYILSECISGRFPIDGLAIWDAEGSGRKWPALELNPYYLVAGEYARLAKYPNGIPPYRGPGEPINPADIATEFWSAKNARTDEHGITEIPGMNGNDFKPDDRVFMPKLVNDASGIPALDFRGLNGRQPDGSWKYAGAICETLNSTGLPGYWFATFYRESERGTGAIVGGMGDQSVYGQSLETRMDRETGEPICTIWNGGPAAVRPGGWEPGKWGVLVGKCTDRQYPEIWSGECKWTSYKPVSGSRGFQGVAWGCRGRLNTTFPGLLGELMYVDADHLTDDEIRRAIEGFKIESGRNFG